MTKKRTITIKSILSAPRGRALPVVLFLGSILGFADAQELSITQIDTGRLLNRQEADAYIQIQDSRGLPLEGLSAEKITLEEAEDSDSPRWKPARLLTLEEGINQEAGISFYLMMDNSGSMYDTLAGEKTDQPEETRMAAANRVLRSFLSRIDNPRDRAGLVSFNTYYRVHQEAGSAPGEVEARLAEGVIERPRGQEVLTELYASLVLAARDLGGQEGRRTVILLSDGENFPFYPTQGGDPHPDWGKREASADEVIETFQEEGLTLYAVGLGAQKDPLLEKITEATGGNLYDARTEEDLSRIYQDIRGRLLTEYRLRYRPTPAASRQKLLRITVDTPGGTAVASRPYYSSTLLGDTPSGFSLWLLIPLLAGLGLLLLINLRDWRERIREPRLKVLGNAVGTVVRPQVALGARTVIGNSDKADLTIAGDPGIGSAPVTIAASPEGKGYTIAAPGTAAGGKGPALTQIAGVTVNHQPAQPGQSLENGDVITMGGATIIYEEPHEAAGQEKKDNSKKG